MLAIYIGLPITVIIGTVVYFLIKDAKDDHNKSEPTIDVSKY